MDFFSRVRTQYLSWRQDTPLPADDPDALPIFQAWHEFDESREQWAPVDASGRGADADERTGRRDRDCGRDDLVLVTWNVDAAAVLAESRIEAIISRVLGLDPAVDVIFLQEVSKPALSFILAEPRIRRHWFSSEPDAANWGGHLFASMTLLSRTRFGCPMAAEKLGAVWRVKYPSNFGRDALFCDVLLASSPTAGPAMTAAAADFAPTRVRFANVHLDSLPMRPSRRPRQVAIVASFLRAAGRGLVAGDFNPVLAEDDALIRDNGLVDAWAELHPGDAGFTWGVDGEQPFPPNRLDKIATVGLRVREVEILHPGLVGTNPPPADQTPVPTEQNIPTGPEEEGPGRGEPVPWSDHSGLRCTLRPWPGLWLGREVTGRP